MLAKYFKGDRHREQLDVCWCHQLDRFLEHIGDNFATSQVLEQNQPGISTARLYTSSSSDPFQFVS
jgi:hypothetical protein